MIEQRDKDEFETEARNFRSHCDALANRLIAQRDGSAAGAVLVLERTIYQLANEVSLLLSPLLPAAPPPVAVKPAKGKRAPAGGGEHRHKFDGAGVCTLEGCGAQRQRAARGQGERSRPEARASAEARTGALPGTGVEVRDNGDWR